MFVPEDMADKATKYSGKDATYELGFHLPLKNFTYPSETSGKNDGFPLDSYLSYSFCWGKIAKSLSPS